MFWCSYSLTEAVKIDTQYINSHQCNCQLLTSCETSLKSKLVKVSLPTWPVWPVEFTWHMDSRQGSCTSIQPWHSDKTQTTLIQLSELLSRSQIQGCSTSKLQNSATPLIFKIWTIQNINSAGNFEFNSLTSAANFIIMTSLVNTKYDDTASIWWHRHYLNDPQIFGPESLSTKIACWLNENHNESRHICMQSSIFMYLYINPFNASWSKLLLFEGPSAILV